MQKTLVLVFDAWRRWLFPFSRPVAAETVALSSGWNSIGEQPDRLRARPDRPRRAAEMEQCR